MLDKSDIRQFCYAMLILFGLIVLLLFWILCLGIIISRHNIYLLIAWISITVLLICACTESPW